MTSGLWRSLMSASTGSLLLDLDFDPDAPELPLLDRDPSLFFATFLLDPLSVFVALLAIVCISFWTA
jgi:hypothetical protein